MIVRVEVGATAQYTLGTDFLTGLSGGWAQKGELMLAIIWAVLVVVFLIGGLAEGWPQGKEGKGDGRGRF